MGNAIMQILTTEHIVMRAILEHKDVKPHVWWHDPKLAARFWINCFDGQFRPLPKGAHATRVKNQTLGPMMLHFVMGVFKKIDDFKGDKVREEHLIPVIRYILQKAHRLIQ